MILVLGHQGILASALKEAVTASGAETVFVGRAEADLLNPDELADVMERVSPKVVINAAAYTSVDQAESEPEAADRVNAELPASLARYCAGRDIPLVHVSTDHVFDGKGGAPYKEQSDTAPVNRYGASKLAGEQAIRSSGARFGIIRTSWVQAAHSGCFIAKILRAAHTNDDLKVVSDQVGSPTLAADLATACLAVAGDLADERDQSGLLLHFASPNHAHWAEVAECAMYEAARLGAPTATVTPIATHERNDPAKRPPDSRLDSSAFLERYGFCASDWRDGVGELVAKIHAGL